MFTQDYTILNDKLILTFNLDPIKRTPFLFPLRRFSNQHKMKDVEDKDDDGKQSLTYLQLK